MDPHRTLTRGFESHGMSAECSSTFSSTVIAAHRRVARKGGQNPQAGNRTDHELNFSGVWGRFRWKGNGVWRGQMLS